ncbi:DNA-methyltransferase [Propionibacterium freudenreichii]|uniref:DNA-methyltransferase n=1 Tax=Propionibacterium freudenreichii TaxID=1744 RepID=UPI00070BC371|nr:site-specific DNA-methyltransferase [Propionibacterium freudenreichii]MDK9674415.1 site-specific DNA-methyltransferase [Propionibacterium freudenreichii]SCQ46805.1 Adenine DNA methyltransferase [Propionibacterium freudenreichii]
MVTPFFETDRVQLFGGDSLAVLRDLPSHSVDAVITDPPYSSGGMVRGDRTQSTVQKYVSTGSSREDDGFNFTGDNRDQHAFAYWSALWLSEARRVTRPGGIVATFTDWRQLAATTDAVQAGGWVWRGVLPWIKPNARPQLGRFTNQAEFVVWGSNGPMANLKEGKTFAGWMQESPPRDRDHITQKPLDVMRHLIGPVTPGGTVLDPFMGSGTTGCAAILEGRQFIGIEMVPRFQEVARARIEQALGDYRPDAEQSALFDGGAT